MFAVLVFPPDWHPDRPDVRRFAYPGHEITIGRAETNALILTPAEGARDGEGKIEDHHARLIMRDGMFVISDLESESRTFVNGFLLDGAMLIRETDRVQIGGYTLEVQHAPTEPLDAYPEYVAEDPTEAALLRAIAARDETSRTVYADWLEQRGDVLRAEFLRVQEELLELSPGDAAFPVHASRLSALAARIDVAWRVQVASPSVERCGLAFDFQCPMEWSMLHATGRDGVRHCGACNKDVYYALSVGEARAHARRGRCVALDITSPRWPGDLAEPYGHRVCEDCETDIGRAYPGDDCPTCGHVRRRMAIGSIID
ncbi:MAG TPA: TIGR02996 domain-containing protein [Kofleriaceae bacterium]|nr:TIGR02996 domain-containing protein [Kofleriaceae bacterium]